MTEVGWPLPNRSPTRNFALPDNSRGGATALMADAMGSGNCNVSGMTLFTWTSAMSNPVEQEDWFGIERPNLAPTRVGRAPTRARCGATRRPARWRPAAGGLEAARARPAAEGQAGHQAALRDRDGHLRGLPLDHVRVAIRANGRTIHPLTDKRGLARLCFRGKPKISARAAMGRWAQSAKRSV